MKEALCREDRALAGYVALQFLGSLVFFSLMWVALNEALMQMGAFSATLPASSESLETGRTYVQQAWTYSPIFAATAATLALQARAAFESAGGSR